MLVIRFFRVGKKNQPSFKIVVTDKRRPPKGGQFLEEVGFYNPVTKEKILKGERIKYWLSVGAKPSATLHNLLVKEKIIEGKKFPKHKKAKKTTTRPPPSQPSAGPLKEEITPEEKPTSEKSVPEEPKEKKAKETANSDK